MCRPFSFKVRENLDIVFDPEHTDGHTDLEEFYGVSSDGHSVSCEFYPEYDVRWDEPEKFTFVAETRPEWWTAYVEARIREDMIERVRRMIVTDTRKLLLGGCWIICGSARVDRVLNARVVAVFNNAKIARVFGNAQIARVLGNAQIADVFGNAQITNVFGNAQITNVFDNAQITNVFGNAQIARVFDNAQIADVLGNAQIADVFGNAQIENDRRTKEDENASND